MSDQHETITPIPDPLAVEASPLSRAQAQALTRKVVAAGDKWWALLAETHEKKAYAAMGYHSWETYAERELGMSGRNAYRLLDQGRVVLALEQAGVTRASDGSSPDQPQCPKTSTKNQAPPVSARQAEVLKPDLPAATKEIAAAVAGGATPEEAVKGAVAARRPLPPTPSGPMSVTRRDTSPPPCVRCKGTGVEPVKAHTVRHGADRPAEKDCAHPPTMRLGRGCGLCGKDPV